MIVNELVSNGIKHAFLQHRIGQIELVCSKGPDKASKIVASDDEVGLLAKFDCSKTASLGLKLVTNLVWQMVGILSVDGSDGTRFEICFSLPQ